MRHEPTQVEQNAVGLDALAQALSTTRNKVKLCAAGCLAVFLAMVIAFHRYKSGVPVDNILQEVTLLYWPGLCLASPLLYDLIVPIFDGEA